VRLTEVIWKTRFRQKLLFWDTHDSTDYLEHLIPVGAIVKLMRRHYEIELEEDVMEALQHLANVQHIPADKLANDLLKKQLAVK